MFNNYLILKENNNNTLYLFINSYNSFKKYYRYYRKNKKNELLKIIYLYLKKNNEQWCGEKIVIVVEGVVTNSFFIKEKD